MWKKRSKKVSFKRKNLAILLIFLSLISALFLIYSKSGFLIIDRVDIVLNGIDCTNEDEIRNSSGILEKNIFSVNFNNVSENLRNKFYCIEKVNLTYLFPSKVKIQTSPRQPEAIVFTYKNTDASSSALLENLATPSAESSSEVFVMDKEGVIFSKKSLNFQAINIFIENLDPHLGLNLSYIKPANMFKIFDKVKTFGIEIKNAAVFHNILIIFSDPKIIFKNDDKVDIQLASLQLILSEAKINSRKLEFIDLRFDKPIVRFAPPGKKK